MLDAADPIRALLIYPRVLALWAKAGKRTSRLEDAVNSAREDGSYHE